MKRLLAQVAALSAAVLACACIASAGIVTPHRIDETFSGTSIDYPHTWWSWGTNQPDAVTFKQANGVMNINVAATAQNDFNVSGATLCRARGDFDATVDFNLPTWPTGDGIWVMLQMTGTPFNVYRVTWQFQPSEAYGAFFPPAGTSLPATGTSGTLRLSRRGDIFTGYYWNGLSWVPIISGVGPKRGEQLAVCPSRRLRVRLSSSRCRWGDGAPTRHTDGSSARSTDAISSRPSWRSARWARSLCSTRSLTLSYSPTFGLRNSNAPRCAGMDGWKRKPRR